MNAPLRLDCIEKMSSCRLRLALLPHTECLLAQLQYSTHTTPTTPSSTTGLCVPFLPEKRQRRMIQDKASFILPDDYPEPWPYKEKSFNRFHMCYDWTKPRFHQNSKLITVEGNIGSGKSAFAEELADRLGFHYMPAFSMKDILIDRYGNDFRNFYHLFPKRFRVPDELSFYKNPADDLTAVMQNRIYECRWEQYLNALAHIFNTGQGVVLEKSVHSDFVYVNAMRDKNWLSPEYFKYYHFMRKISLPKLQFLPHLVIYLDCPVSKCLENIKKRGNPDEIAAVDERYLTVIADSYKDMLKEVQRESYILTYDWGDQPEHMDFVQDDICAFNMDFAEWHSGEKLETWFNIGDDMHYGLNRWKVTYKKGLLWRTFTPLEKLHEEVSELHIYPPDGVHFKNVVHNEILKDRCTYGYTHKDPIRDIWHIETTITVPEKWFEYFWKDMWFDALQTPDGWIDPSGIDYHPEYLHQH